MRSIISIAAAFALIAFAGTTVNAQFNHPDVFGATVDYTDIEETTNTGSELFGAPSVSGDNLVFPVSGYTTNAVDSAVDFLNGSVELTATSDSSFNSVSVSEFGIYTNLGATSESTVATFLFVTVDGVTFSESILQTFGEGIDSWTADLTVEIPDTASAIVRVHNILTSTAGAGEIASIAKRDAQVQIDSSKAIPEPAAASLLALGIAGFAARRRRA